MLLYDLTRYVQDDDGDWDHGPTVADEITEAEARRICAADDAPETLRVTCIDTSMVYGFGLFEIVWTQTADEWMLDLAERDEGAADSLTLSLSHGERGPRGEGRCCADGRAGRSDSLTP